MISKVLTKSPEVDCILRQPLFILNEPNASVLQESKRFTRISTVIIWPFGWICILLPQQHTPYTMKRLLITAAMLAAAIAFGSCEKAEIEKEKEPAGQTDDPSGGWLEEVGGEEDDGFETGSVVDVATFRNNDIGRQVWVKGYIVGAATGANNRVRYELEPPFTYDTAILLADDPAETSVDKMISVRLVQGERRELLNLADHPENRGERIAVFGLRETYLKMPGIQDIDAYKFPLD